MNLNDSLNQMSKDLLDFFFPRHCPFCGRVSEKRCCASSVPGRCPGVRRSAPAHSASAPRRCTMRMPSVTLFSPSSSGARWKTSTASAR